MPVVTQRIESLGAIRACSKALGPMLFTFASACTLGSGELGANPDFMDTSAKALPELPIHGTRAVLADATASRPPGAASDTGDRKAEAMAIPVPIFDGPGVLIPKAYFGQHIHRARTIGWPTVTFGTWRLWDAEGAGWSIENTKGRRDYAAADVLMRLAEQADVDVIWTLGGLTPQWASARPQEKCGYGSGCAAEPASMGDWEAYVRDVATRYKGRIKFYEIWNEPNLASPYVPGSDFYSGSPEMLVELTRVAYRTIKSVDPSAMVLSPAPVAEVKRIEPFYRLGGGAYVDVVVAHFYTLEPEALASPVREFQALMKRYGLSGKELWNTESGYLIGGSKATFRFVPGGVFANKLGEPEAAGLLSRYVVLGGAFGLKRSVLYAWDNDLMGFTANRGQRPTVVTQALQRTTTWLMNARLLGCGTRSGALWVCELDRSGRRAWLVWNTERSLLWQTPSRWGAVAMESLTDDDRRELVNGAVTVNQTPVLLKADSEQWGP